MHRKYFHAPLLLNAVWWTFIGLMAFYVTPFTLALLVVVPGFSSSPEVEVERNGAIVRVRGSGDMSENEIRTVVKEAMGR